MGFEYGVDEYRILSNILKLKFGLELQDSGIILKNIYLLKDLVSGRESYLLLINSTQIRFVTQRDFVHHFIRFLCSTIKALDEKYCYLRSIELNEFTDNVSIEIEYKTIDYHLQRQRMLLQKMIKIRDQNKN
jgi:hypothetical protein